jgi:putative SOS response-associated peptidase YedK
VAEDLEIEAALLFRSQRRRGFRVRRNLASLDNARGNAVGTCSILTTTPNAVTAAVHDRIPVILDLDSYDLLLDPGLRNVDFVSELLKPYSARMMRSYPVSSRINRVVNYDEECSAPIELAQIQNQLFY